MRHLKPSPDYATVSSCDNFIKSISLHIIGGVTMADPIFDEIKRLHHEMNKAFDNFFKRPSMRLLKEDSKNLIRRPLSMLLQPITDVIMKGNEIIARFDMPGIDKKDIDLKVTEDYLEVKAERRTSGRVSKKGIVSEESSFKSYYRIYVSNYWWLQRTNSGSV